MESNSVTGEPTRKSRNQKASFTTSVLRGSSFLSGCMLFLAVPNLVGGDPWMVGIKAILLAVAGVLISYAVNKLAVERGAPLAVANYMGAAIVSVLSILIVGFGLFAATYAGLVIKDVDQLVIYEHGERLSQAISQVTENSAEAGRGVAATSAIVNDLQQKLGCEIEISCISGRGNGGNGPVAKALLEKVGRAESLAREVQAGESARVAAVADLTELYAQYRAVASNDAAQSAKRNDLADLDLKIKQAAARLKEAVPVELLRSYAEELKAGVDIPGRAEAAAKLSAIFYQHGESLSRLLETIPTEKAPLPSFPKAPGVTDTFSYIGHFLPVAAIAAVVELIFPISLWLYTYFVRDWALRQVAEPEERQIDPEEKEVQQLLAPPRRSEGHGVRGGSQSADDRSRADRPSLTPRGRRDH